MPNIYLRLVGASGTWADRSGAIFPFTYAIDDHCRRNDLYYAVTCRDDLYTELKYAVFSNISDSLRHKSVQFDSIVLDMYSLVSVSIDPNYAEKMLRKLAEMMGFSGTITVNCGAVDTTYNTKYAAQRNRVTLSVSNMSSEWFDFWWLATRLLREMCYISRQPKMVLTWFEHKYHDRVYGTHFKVAKRYAWYLTAVRKDPSRREKIVGTCGGSMYMLDDCIVDYIYSQVSSTMITEQQVRELGIIF